MRLVKGGERHDERFLADIATARRTAHSAPERHGRRAFLLAQLGALERRAQFLGGRKMSIRDESAALGLSIPVYDHERVIDLRRQLEAVLPGRGSLSSRLAEHRRASGVPRARLERAATQSVDECRRRTPSGPELRDSGIELRYVIDRPWPAYTTYRGNGRSVVEIRRDVAWLEDDLLRIVCHETYPGHHLQNLVWEELRTANGWAEFAVIPPFTPHAVMAERAAIAATGLVVGERPRVTRILDGLAPFAAVTAVAVLDGDISRTAGLARLRDDLLMPDADGFLAFVERHRAMAVAYVTPTPEVSDWQSYVALLRSPARLIAGAAQ